MTEQTTHLPETPHELPIDRGKVDELMDRARKGERFSLLEGFLGAVAWEVAFGGEDGSPLSPEDRDQLVAYYREKFSDVGPLFLAELLSTEFMTELRARGDIVFSDQMLLLGREEPQLWNEVRQFFRRKELATGLLSLAAREELPPHDE